jgi:hypothetical protein
MAGKIARSRKKWRNRALKMTKKKRRRPRRNWRMVLRSRYSSKHAVNSKRNTRLSPREFLMP